MGPPAIAEAPSRTCPRCGREERTEREHCSHCGCSVPPARPSRRGRRRAAGHLGRRGGRGPGRASIALVREQWAPRNDRERKPSTKAIAAELMRLHRLQTPHAAPPHSSSRARAPPLWTGWLRVRPSCAPRRPRSPATRRPATAPVSSRARSPRTECGPLLKAKDAVPDDRILSKAIGRYDCVAIKRSVTGEGGQSVGRLGFPFVAALDFEKFTYTWCRNTPGQGERGVALAFVRLDRACLAAKGRALGTGYVDVPGS